MAGKKGSGKAGEKKKSTTPKKAAGTKAKREEKPRVNLLLILIPLASIH